MQFAALRPQKMFHYKWTMTIRLAVFAVYCVVRATEVLVCYRILARSFSEQSSTFRSDSVIVKEHSSE